MKHFAAAAALAAFALPLLADWNVHVNIGSPPDYGYAPAEAVYVERYVPACEVPLVFVAARHARVRPVVIVETWRRGGWNLVCARFGVPRAVLFVPAPPVPPRAAVYYDRHPAKAMKPFRHESKRYRGRWRD